MKLRALYPLALATLMLANSAYGARLTVDEALAAATATTQFKVAGLNTKTLTLAYTQNYDNIDALYVLSRASGGYVVIAADDVCTPVLGYADNGVFDPANIPPAMKGWLEDYARQIAWAARNNARVVAAPANPMLDDIAPITRTKWNQDAPYNDLCPDVNGQMTYTGCVATAIAQVLKVYEYPATGQGSVSYNWNNRTLSLDFSEITFDWDNMLDTYRGVNATDEQKHAVAELMYACGIASYMNYGTGGSGANSINTAVGMVNNFNYDLGIRYLLRDYYPLPQWCTMIHNELAQGKPVYYSGANSQVGHAFVLDGYRKSDGLFHVNWGWGGMSDGYFAITTLDPDSQGIGGSTAGYALGQGAILNLKPAEAGSKISPEFVAEGNLMTPDTHLDRAEEEYVTITAEDGGFYSLSLASMTVEFGVRLTAADNTSTEIFWAYEPISIQPYNGFSGFEIATSLFPEEGEYILTPIARVGDEVYDVHYYVSDNSSLKVSCTPEYIDFEQLNTIGQLTLTGARALSPFYRGKACLLEATVTNHGNEYYGTIEAMLKQTTGTPKSMGSAIVDLLDGESETIMFSGSLPFLVKTGESEVYFVDARGNVIGDAITIEIQTPPNGSAVAEISDLTFPTAGKVTETNNEYTVHFPDYGFNMGATLTGVSGYFTAPVYAYFFGPGQTSSSTRLGGTPAYVGPLTSAEITIKGDFTGMFESETPYAVLLTTGNTAEGSLSDTRPSLTCYFNSSASVEAVESMPFDARYTPGSVSATAPAGITGVEVFNIAGIKLFEAKCKGTENSVSLAAPALAAGHYIVRISTASSAATCRMLIH